MLNDSNIDRFFVKVEFTEECWNWTAAKSYEGYGRFKIEGKLYQATRLSYEFFYGYIDDRLICHHCDNPSCVNPGHLFLGTYSENLIDSIQKGRIMNVDHLLAYRGIRRIISFEGYNWCYGCKKHLLISCFTKNKAKKDGLETLCKPCRKIYRSQRRFLSRKGRSLARPPLLKSGA